MPNPRPEPTSLPSQGTDTARLFGRRLQRLVDVVYPHHRQRHTDAEIAAHVGVTAQYISKLRNGKSVPSVEKAQSLAEFFGVEQVDYFLKPDDDAVVIVVERRLRSMEDLRTGTGTSQAPEGVHSSAGFFPAASSGSGPGSAGPGSDAVSDASSTVAADADLGSGAGSGTDSGVEPGVEPGIDSGVDSDGRADTAAAREQPGPDDSLWHELQMEHGVKEIAMRAGQLSPEARAAVLGIVNQLFLSEKGSTPQADDRAEGPDADRADS
jgi:transcriptional regulator with XRE-family HTH domain